METVEGEVFQKSLNQKFRKVHQMTPNQSQGIAPYVSALLYPESQIFVRFAL